MSFVSRFLMFLSKTDRRVIAHCTDFAQKTQATYGVFVLLTGAFAFLSCVYAVSTSFDSPFVYVPVAVLYSILIISIDREIVSAMNRWMTLPRLVLALVIGLVISVPLEMRMFAGSIRQEKERLNKNENQDAVNQKLTSRQAFEKKVSDLDNEIKGYRQNIAEASLAMQEETAGAVREGAVRTGKAGRGPAYEEAKRQKEVNEQLLSEATGKLAALIRTKNEVYEEIDEAYELKNIKPVDDLLTNYVAMEHFKKTSPASREMAWGLRALIILIEVIPALIKLLHPLTEYTALVEAMRRRNITRVYAVVNDHMDQTIAQPHLVPTPTLLQQLEQDPLTR